MNDNLAEFLFNTAMVVFFVAAVSLFFLMNDFSNDMVSLVQQNINQQKEVVEVREEVPDNTLKGDEIIANIISGAANSVTTSSAFSIDGTGYDVENPFDFEHYSDIDVTSDYSADPVCDTKGKALRWNYVN
ncbi:MAG TPA: hypothetical protein VHT96_06790 [Clostridia bacterium]|nr:hypothetical protein [Clostridia bacterium]